jgi:hypothetical protein
MTVVTRGLNINTVIELGLRFGWLKPIPTGVKTPKGELWKLYSKDWTRRTVTVRKGKMSTQEFIGLWKNCRSHAERCAAFGGLLEEVEMEMRAWSAPFSIMVKYLEYRQAYTWDFDPREGAWVFQPCVTNAQCDHWLREKYDIHKWTARSKDGVVELADYLKERLGVD